MCGPLGFEPYLPKGMTLPEGYELAGESGEGFDGGRLTVYYWWQEPADGEMRFGPSVRDKRRAVRQAWRDHRSGGTDATAVEST